MVLYARCFLCTVRLLCSSVEERLSSALVSKKKLM